MKDDKTDQKGTVQDDKALAIDGDDDEEDGDDPLVWIPKKLMTEWKTGDGVRCLTLIIQLTGGSAASDNNGVEIKVSNNGLQFVISEVWSPLMSRIADFYTYFPKPIDETNDEFTRRRFAMEDNVQGIMGQASMTSIYRMTLPFKVDPSVTRIRFLGTSDGCRFAHVDLAEKKKFEVEQVIMIDTTKKRHNLPSSEKKRNYCSL